MAAGMNSLYITNDHNYCSTSMFNPDDNLNMEFNDLPIPNERYEPRKRMGDSEEGK